MILFRKEHVPMILAGTKTQTRRLGKRRWKVDSIHDCKTTYFAEPFARIRILEVRNERLGDISDDDIGKEGYAPKTDDYKEVFAKIYGGWNPELLVWVITFELAQEEPGVRGKYAGA